MIKIRTAEGKVLSEAYSIECTRSDARRLSCAFVASGSQAPLGRVWLPPELGLRIVLIVAEPAAPAKEEPKRIE